ncbi:MAG: hypothetical protein ABI675_16825 [Chitinophagaceae bacterium]
MKSKILLRCLIFFTLIATSCKKERDTTIIGKWISTSNYTEENGNFSWRPTDGFSQVITFNPDARFSTFIDMPTGSGTYTYDSRAAKIDLNYEADHYGTVPATVTYKIDELANDRLIVSSFSLSGNLQFKTEYIRHD